MTDITGAEAPTGTETVEDIAKSFNDQTADAPKPDPVRQWAAGQMAKETKTAQDTAVSAAVKTMKGNEALAGFSDEMLEGFIFRYGYHNPAFAEAFTQRDNNSTAWTDALGKATSAAVEVAKVPDGKVTEDLNAARTSVAGETETPPPATNDGIKPQRELNAMSDAELRTYKESLLMAEG